MIQDETAAIKAVFLDDVITRSIVGIPLHLKINNKPNGTVGVDNVEKATWKTPGTTSTITPVTPDPKAKSAKRP